MKYQGACNTRGHNTYICPAKYLGRTKGKPEWKVKMERCPLGKLCEPDSKMGPLAYLRFDEDHRYNTVIPRESDKFKEMYKKRTSTERLFSQFEDNVLSSRVYRRMHLFQMRLTCQSINIHTRLWVRTRFANKKLDDGKVIIECLKEILTDLKKKTEDKAPN